MVINVAIMKKIMAVPQKPAIELSHELDGTILDTFLKGPILAHQKDSNTFITGLLFIILIVAVKKQNTLLVATSKTER